MIQAFYSDFMFKLFKLRFAILTLLVSYLKPAY